MYFQLKHLNRIIKDLNKLRISDSHEIKDVRIMTGDIKGYYTLDYQSELLKDFKPGDRWGDTEEYSLFRSKVRIPHSMHGKHVILWFDTQVDAGHALSHRSGSGWNEQKRSQYVLYVNGKATQGIDGNHVFATLATNARENDEYEIALEAFPSTSKGFLEMYMSLKVIDEKTDELYYNLKVPVDATNFIEDEKIRLDIWTHMEKAVGMLDLRIPYSDLYYESVMKANEYIEHVFTHELANNEEVIVKGIGHTHIDVAWLWPVSETRQKVVRSFSTVLNLMKLYPEYKFMSSQPQLYQFLKEENIDLYNEVKLRIKEGRWEAEGGMWLEADCNLVSGESFVRQILFGKRFFKEEFNVDNRILWLPDVFGYSAALPQILKKSGIDYFMTTKISWNEYNTLPYDTFNWRGIDGTEVFTHFVTTSYLNNKFMWGGYTYNGELCAEQVAGTWKNYKNKDINNETYTSFGWGDGGGGPTREMLEEGRRLARGIKGIPKFEIEQPGKFFDRLHDRVKDNKRLPTWVGELYLEYHRGTYTTMARNKRDNRHSELLFREVELFDMIASQKGLMDYPQELINKNWEKILLNQFHDILPGSSIKQVYDDSARDYADILGNGSALLNDSLEKLSLMAADRKRKAVVFNQLSFKREDVVAIRTDSYFTHALTDNHEKIPGQMIDTEQGSAFIFNAVAPSMGYQTYEMINEKESPSLLTATMQLLENDFFSLTFNDEMNIVSIYDKKNEREVLRNGELGNQLLAYEDKPYAWDAWDVNIYYKDKVWPVNDVESVEIIEQGPVRAGLKIRRRFLQSIIEQTIIIYSKIKRIDFVTFADWKQSDILLKVTFPIEVNAAKASYDIQFGNVERPTHFNTSWDYARFEVCAHKWADLSDAGYGVSLMNDSKYGYDIKDNRMSLSLLKSPTNPNPAADKEEHHFTYSLYPHAGDFREADTIAEAYQLNCPLIGRYVEKGKGKADSEYSYIHIDQKNVVIETVKQCEYDHDTIIRMYESFNKTSTVKVTLAEEIESVYECDLLENPEQKIISSEKTFTVTVKPFEIKTYKIKFK
ncbi:MAG: alpha-mannosidase [Clostridia bacterium]|nr:alpha-mannosidase [Clostridia bacterium]